MNEWLIVVYGTFMLIHALAQQPMLILCVSVQPVHCATHGRRRQGQLSRRAGPVRGASIAQSPLPCCMFMSLRAGRVDAEGVCGGFGHRGPVPAPELQDCRGGPGTCIRPFIRAIIAIYDPTQSYAARHQPARTHGLVKQAAHGPALPPINRDGS